MNLNTIICGDALTELKKMPDNLVHCCITSPPYYSLRDYGVPGQIGLEKTPEEYIQKIVEVFREVNRVLHSSGTLWLNMGDSYAGSGKGIGSNHGKAVINDEEIGPRMSIPMGIKPKDLLMMPFRVALALQANGWYLRSVMPWLKRNSMPESVTDRPSTAVEYLFLLTKSSRYFYDEEAIRLPARDWGTRDRKAGSAFVDGTPGRARQSGGKNCNFSQTGRNFRNSDHFFNSWQGIYEEAGEPLAFIVNPKGFKEAHFATFPEKLVEPCIKAGTSEKGICSECGEPWVRILEKKPATMNIRVRDNKKGIIDKKSGIDGKYKASQEEIQNYGNEELGEVKTIGWKPNCSCTPPSVPNTPIVFDPFCGSGTVCAVALKLFRRYFGIDLNPIYNKMSDRRTDDAESLFARKG